MRIRKEHQMEIPGRFSALFLSHGAPDILLGDSPLARFLKSLGSLLETPDRIILVSAHWQTALPTLGSADSFSTIHDFMGFPEELYRIRYPATGEPLEARQLQEKLKNAGIPCQLDPERGLDHGAWVPLIAIYPDASVPVIPVSLPMGYSPDDLMQLGTFLRESYPEKTLLIASGGSTHNLQAYRPGRSPYPEIEAFDAWLRKNLIEKKSRTLLDFRTNAPSPRFNHPTEEHFLPIFVAMGFGYDTTGPIQLHEEISGGSLSLASYGFPRQPLSDHNGDLSGSGAAGSSPKDTSRV
jgi:4,5-DOPA dioxygenase extradiol|uniref:Dioxygenase n=1 Tax=Leptospirillum ferriphilum TaxID=178606 RepID=A0A7C3LU82_9BACT